MKSLHQPRALTAVERQRFRDSATTAYRRKAAAEHGEGLVADPVGRPALRPLRLMPKMADNGIRALSLFSGGGGLDLGFHRAGFVQAASYEILPDAAATLAKAHPEWTVYGGEDGDVRGIDWRRWRRKVDVLHGGPPCQPFSCAGRQQGAADPRNMWPEFVRATLEALPDAFVAENVPALAGPKFASYFAASILEPLQLKYTVLPPFLLSAAGFGLPQSRRRMFLVGFRSKASAARYQCPTSTHDTHCGVRWALGLPDIGFDGLSPTIRSTLNGPRNTTSILNSVAAKRVFEALRIWPNGVAPNRERARRFPTPNGHFRLSVPDVALIQGFPASWPFTGPTYMMLGQIGNAVPPPMAYQIACSVAAAL